MTKFGAPHSLARRPGTSQTKAISNDGGDCDVIDMAGSSGATVLLLSGSATLGTIYASDTEDGTYNPVCDKEGTAATVALNTAKRCQLPIESWSEEFLKIVANATGSVSVKPKS
jgi:hypothetical protein